MLSHMNFTQLCCYCYSISWIEFNYMQCECTKVLHIIWFDDVWQVCVFNSL